MKFFVIGEYINSHPELRHGDRLTVSGTIATSLVQDNDWAGEGQDADINMLINKSFVLIDVTPEKVWMLSVHDHRFDLQWVPGYDFVRWAKRQEELLPLKPVIVRAMEVAQWG